MRQHAEDQKITAVEYYIKHKDLRKICKIFKCKYQSLARWVNKYKMTKTLKRKIRKNHNLKITPEIEKFINDNYIIVSFFFQVGVIILLNLVKISIIY